MIEPRYIVRQHETIAIPDGMTGVPVRAYFASRSGRPGALPTSLDGRAYIARPDEIEGRDG